MNPDPVVAECQLPDPPEKVWRALTTPELLSRWLMPNDIRPQVGNRFRFEPRGKNEGGENKLRGENGGGENKLRGENGGEPRGENEPQRANELRGENPLQRDNEVRRETSEPVAAARGPIDCEVLASEPGRLLRYSWRGPRDERDAHGCTLDSVVTFELTPTADGGTHLRVLHEGLLPRGIVASALIRRQARVGRSRRRGVNCRPIVQDSLRRVA